MRSPSSSQLAGYLRRVPKTGRSHLPSHDGQPPSVEVGPALGLALAASVWTLRDGYRTATCG